MNPLFSDSPFIYYPFFSFSQKSFNSFPNLIHFNSGIEKLDNLSFTIDQKLWKVPRDELWWVAFFVKKLTIFSEVPVDGMGIRTIYFYFFKESKLRIESFLNKLDNFFLTPTFLFEELVARKGQYFKSLWFKLIIHLSHLFIVCWGKWSFAGNIHHKDSFFPFVLLKINELSFNVFNFKVEKRRRVVPLKGLLSWFEEDRSHAN